ncbi:hypothetical protein PV04_08044 [Phialophora macrospora]|uniref:Uncharacterized protein n=1 Tax=Phialophora macrospora TaxID=1851006 RepID=A0A0D2FCS3_9EURO|nr:hypothetical protein PV04_08044 [Phialophora macrospora]
MPLRGQSRNAVAPSTGQHIRLRPEAPFVLSSALFEHGSRPGKVLLNHALACRSIIPQSAVGRNLTISSPTSTSTGMACRCHVLWILERVRKIQPGINASREVISSPLIEQVVECTTRWKQHKHLWTVCTRA